MRCKKDDETLPKRMVEQTGEGSLYHKEEPMHASDLV